MSGKYGYRGFMLDVSRHYMPVGDIRRIIEAAALCGMNVMHWHLTDDQGWRVEIKRYPRLTEVGSRRGPSHFGAVSETENNNGWYAQDEVREVVAFAGERGIQVVPELEVPGHASAMLAAYPEYGCAKTVFAGGGLRRVDAPYQYRPMTVGGIFPNLLCAGKDEAIHFLEDILDELLALFPGEFFHIGGDEALKLHWRRCPDCQRRIREEGLKDEEELQRWLVLKIGDYLARRGKRVIVWNESLAGGLLPKHFIVQHWRGNDAETAAFMAAGGSVICSDVQHYYLDYCYADSDAHGIWSAALPEYARGHEDGLLGVECPLWTERVTNIDRAACLLFPRLAAAGLWLNEGRPGSWEAARDALRALRAKIEPLGLKWAPERDWRLTPEDAEADRAAEYRRRHTPEADVAARERWMLQRQDDIEAELRASGMDAALAAQVGDAAWRSALPAYCGAVGEIGPEAEALARKLLEEKKPLYTRVCF